MYYANIPQPVIGSFGCHISMENNLISLYYFDRKEKMITTITIPHPNSDDFSFDKFTEFVYENTVNVEKQYSEIVKGSVIYDTYNNGRFQIVNYFDAQGNFLRKNSIPAKGVFEPGRTYKDFCVKEFLDETLDPTAGSTFVPKSIGFGRCPKTGTKKLFFVADNGEIIKTENITEYNESNVMQKIRAAKYLDNQATLTGINNGEIKVRYPKGYIVSFLSYLNLV